MAFEEITPKTYGKRGDPNTVRIAINVDAAKTRKPIASFAIPRAAASDIDLKVGERACFSVGTGIDAGIIQVRSGSGYKVFQTGNETGCRISITASRIAGLKAEKFPATPCEHWIKDGALYIRLPEEILIRETKAA